MESLVMVLAIPAFFLLMAIEYVWGRRKKKNLYRINDTITNLNIGIGNQVIGLLYKGVVLAMLFAVYEMAALFTIPTTWWSVALCLIVYDFIFYWAHRWGHEVNLFWGAHVVHHQSDEYNLSVALRQPWFHNLMAFFLFLPLPLLGFHPLLIGGVSLFATLYQFWIHTKLIQKLPKVVEFIFNTPSHHRVHHGVNPKYIDKNHGAVFIIWDRLFGTFQEEEEAPTYGITTPFNSFNPAWSNVAYYVDLFKTMKRYKPLMALRLLFAKPGWTPDGPSVKSQIEQTELDRDSYNPPLPLGLKLYSILQFGVLAWALIAYMNNFAELTLFSKWMFAGAILFSMVISGGVLERKKWVFFAEFARLLGAAFLINTYYYFNYIDWFYVMLVTSSVLFLLSCVWFAVSLSKNYRQLLLH